MSLISVENVTYTYPTRKTGKALDNLSLSVNEGEFVSVIGPNGCGKSTLGRLLNALLVPTSGTVKVNGLDSSDGRNTFAIRRLVGIVFQNPDNQIVSDTVEDDVAFGLENLGIEKPQMDGIVKECLEQTGLGGLELVKPDRLSGGQKQRVAIAGVLAMKPRCLILDEATSMLDPKGRADVLEAVGRLRKELSLTVIQITHYMEETVDSDVVFVMDKGRVAFSGTPRDVFSRADELVSLGLRLPMATRIARELGLGGTILSEEELVEELGEIHRMPDGLSGSVPDGVSNGLGERGC